MRLFELMVLLAAALLTAMPLAGCGDDDSSTDSDTDTDSDSDSDSDSDTDSDSDSDTDTDSDSDSDSDSDGDCLLICDEAADCPGDDPAANKDEDNFSCDDGHCIWTGCNDNEECADAYPALDWECNDNLAVPMCLPTCTGASDCNVPDSPLYGTDNWSCDDGFCIWTGCNNNEECAEAFPSLSLECNDNLALPICTVTCETAEDCYNEDSGPLMDEDNAVCENNFCSFSGCNNTEECVEAYDESYECVD